MTRRRLPHATALAVKAALALAMALALAAGGAFGSLLAACSTSDAGDSSPSRDGGAVDATSGSSGSRGAGSGASGPDGSVSIRGSGSSGSSGDGGGVGVDAGDATPCGGLGEACCGGTDCASGAACAKGACENAHATDTGAACKRNGDCQSGVCLPVSDSLDVCTSSCTDASSCVPGWTCGPLLGVAGTVCKCTSQPESCNGEDDDCNGVVDDEPAADQACPLATNGAAQSCQGGTCGCAATCGGSPACANLLSDAKNCGACGKTCAPYETCSGAACGCATPYLACGGVCTDPQTDTANCGGCGKTCPAGAACVSGVCGCTVATDSVCNGACIDTKSDGSNCGGCGAVCAGTCSGGRCAQVLATGQAGPGGMATDGAYLYWTSGGAVSRMPTSGGTVTTLYTNPGATLGDIQVYGGRLYWAFTIDSTGGILSMPSSGGNAGSVAGAAGVSFIAVDSLGVYWSASFNVIAGLRNGATQSSNLQDPDPGYGFAVDTSNLYWLDQGLIYRSSLAQGAGFGSPLVTTGFDYSLVVIDGRNVYTNSADTIYAVPEAGGMVTTLATGESGLALMATNGTHLFWTNETQGTVKSVPVGGGVVTTLASGANHPTYLVLDSTNVYWINKVSGEVMTTTQ